MDGSHGSCWSTFQLLSVVGATFVILTVYAKWSPGLSAPAPPSLEYFALCVVGGVLSGVPHTLMTPLDFVKCRVQCGEFTSGAEGLASIRAQHPATGTFLTALCRGWAPTCVGYSLQGALKFGLYEFLKHHVAALTGLPARSASVHVVSSAGAEICADVALAPWEAVKVRIQTTSDFPEPLSLAMPRIWDHEGLHGFYKGLPALWARQVPYTVVKFTAFEAIVGALGSLLRVATRGGHLAVSLAGGFLAGTACALVSHPADAVVSKVNASPELGVAGSVAALGWGGLWRGLGLRLVMIGVLTALQWLIYDTWKVAVGLRTTGSLPAPRPHR